MFEWRVAMLEKWGTVMHSTSKKIAVIGFGLLGVVLGTVALAQPLFRRRHGRYASGLPSHQHGCQESP